MKHLSGYKLYESNDQDKDPIILSIEDRLLDLSDIGAEVIVETWVYHLGNGELEIYDDYTQDSKAKKAYYVSIEIEVGSRYSGAKSAFIHSEVMNRDGDAVSEVVSVDSFEKSIKVLSEVANFISMSKGEGWEIFMDKSSMSPTSLLFGFFIIPNKK